MAKDKRVMLHLTSYAYDPEQIEEQANKMAKGGWLLEKFGSLRAVYRRGKAGEYEYRVQVKEAGIDRRAYAAELAEFGIELVDYIGSLLILRKKADGTPFELYSDIDSRIAQQRKAARYLRWGLMMSLLVGSSSLMNIATGLMTANVIGPHTGIDPVSWSGSIVFFVVCACLPLPFCIVGLIDCPAGLRRAKKKIAALEAERVIQE